MNTITDRVARSAPKRNRLADATVLLVLLAASAGMMLTAPTAGDFSWSDAPRHALNGAFMMDLVRAHPWHNPTAWAMDYYIHYPSLTILFYPPFFYVVEALFYAVFGVSHAVAQLTETLFLFLLGVGAYAFCRQWFSRAAAIGVALMTIGTPEVAYWGRQVMLDIPAYALGLIGVVWACAYLRRGSPRYVYLAVAFLLAAIYTKFNVAFLLVPLAVVALMVRGWRLLTDRHVLIALAIGVVAAVPAAFMVYKFGSANVGSVTGRPGDLSRESLGAWLFYAEQMPHQLGYVMLTVAAIGVIVSVAGRSRVRLEPWIWVLLGVWFAAGYGFFSAISVREPRHDLMALFPVIFLAAIAVETVFGRGRVGQWALLLFGMGTYIYGVFWCPPTVVSGYREIAAYVADHAPANSVVMISGYRDGNFVFDMREHPDRRDLTLVRADKVLLKISVERIRGVEQSDLGEAGIKDLLKSDGVAMIVAQRNFWPDLRELARFTNVLASPDFRLVQTFRITGTLDSNDGADASGTGLVDIFVPTYPVQPAKGQIVIDLPIIGRQMTGQFGKSP